jgi:hypothetical protein
VTEDATVPMNRPARDALAEILAGFLRGDLSNAEFMERLGSLPIASEDAYFHYCPGRLITPMRLLREAISERFWQRLLRHLAFLKTDREPIPFPLASADRSRERVRERGLARRDALALVIALAFWPWLGWWPLVTCWVASFVIHFSGFLRVAPEPTQREVDWWEVEPFADETDWLAHRHLAEAFHVPDQDPLPPNQLSLPSPGFPGQVGLVLLLPICGVALLLVWLLVVWMIVFMLAVWPLHLIVTALVPVGPLEAAESPPRATAQ